MRITADWHVHTPASCDCAENGTGVALETLLARAPELGLASFGVSDHVFTGYNLDELFRSREAFDAAPFNPHFHFGVELGCVSRWEVEEIESGRRLASVYGLLEGGPPGAEPALGFTEEDKREYGVEYVIAGVHRPLYVEQTREAVIADFHRQLLFLAQHPLVDVIAHPWWWGASTWRSEDGTYRSDPWLDDFGKIPLSMHDEFAAAATARGKAVEINLKGCLLNPAYPEDFGRQYVDYLAYLHERGVRFSVGSDAHGPGYAPDFERAGELLDPLALCENDLWGLPPREAPPAEESAEEKPLSKYQQKLQKRKEAGEE
jgi:histidinol phosphatase-like PHP family hydrolase